MAYYDLDNASYGDVRKLEVSDWNHADVFNATIGKVAENAAAIKDAVKRIKGVTVKASGWSNDTYTISSAAIQADSLVEVFFASASKEAAQEAEVDGSTSAGALILTCATAPTDDLTIDCIEVRNEVATDAG